LSKKQKQIEKNIKHKRKGKGGENTQTKKKLGKLIIIKKNKHWVAIIHSICLFLVGKRVTGKEQF